MAIDATEQRWVWIDLEMTGLDDNNCSVIEIAMIITDGELNELASFEAPIWQPPSVLESINPFVRKMHTENGLLDRVRNASWGIDEVEIQAMKVLTKHVGFRQGILSGNSVWQDRRFLRRYMPHVEHYLHYRQIDVSTIKVIAQTWYGNKATKLEKPSTHTALSDIRASIDELRHYRDRLFVLVPHD